MMLAAEEIASYRDEKAGTKMGYTALEAMSKENFKRYGVDYGPQQSPYQSHDGNDLKSAALRFIHERCEDLLFDYSNWVKEMVGNFYCGV